MPLRSYYQNKMTHLIQTIETFLKYSDAKLEALAHQNRALKLSQPTEIDGEDKKGE